MEYQECLEHQERRDQDQMEEVRMEHRVLQELLEETALQRQQGMQDLHQVVSSITSLTIGRCHNIIALGLLVGGEMESYVRWGQDTCGSRHQLLYSGK